MLRYHLPDGRSWKRLWGGVGGVLHDAVGFARASWKENVQDGWVLHHDENKCHWEHIIL